jgi:DNA-binding MarR family transcriptional regulator
MHKSERNLARVEASMDAMRRAMGGARDRLREGLNLTRTQLEILFYLGERAQTTSELAAQLSLTQGAVTQTVDTLVRRDLVARHPGLEDRRVVRLELTAEGKTLMTHLIELKRRRMRDLLCSLSEPEIEALIVVNERLTEMFNEVNTPELKTKRG